MYNAYDEDLIRMRERRRRREERRRKQMLRRRIILSTAVTISIVAIMLIIKVLSSGDESADASANVKQTEDNILQTNPEDSIENLAQQSTEDIQNGSEDNSEPQSPEETTTEGRYDNYGDDLYNDGRFIVCIDPGHGGNDVGCVGYDDSYEKDDSLMLAKYLTEELQALGITVVNTRTTDVWVDLLDRPKFANEQNADLLISLHRNAYAADESVRGFEAWINSYDNENSLEIAELIMSNLEGAGISRNRGVKTGTQDGSDDYRVNARSSMPSVLLEMGFMSSPIDNSLYHSNTKDFAKAIANAVNSWYKTKAY